MNNPFENILPKEVEQKNIALTETIGNTLTPEHFNQIQDALKTGAKLQLVPVGHKGLIIRKNISAELTAEVNTLTESLKAITGITSQESAENANKVLKKAKTLIKDLEADRKRMDQLLNDEKADNKKMEDGLVSALTALVGLVNNSIVAFQKEEERKAHERQKEIQRQKDEELRLAQIERDRVAKIKNNILEFERNVLNAIGSSTLADIDTKIDQLSKYKVTPETYGEFIGDAQIMYQQCVTKFNERKTELLKVAELEKKNAEQAEQLKLEQKAKADQDNKILAEKQRMAEEEKAEKEQEDLANIQMGSELKTAMNTGARGVMKRWVFEEATIDLSLLPLEYHTFDKAKIKEAIASGAREIPGVNIFQELSNVSR